MPCRKNCNSVCGVGLENRDPFVRNSSEHIENTKSFKVAPCFFFFERLPWPDPEQKAKLAVAYSGDANLSHPLSSVKVLLICVWFTVHKPQAERVLTK